MTDWNGRVRIEAQDETDLRIARNIDACCLKPSQIQTAPQTCKDAYYTGACHLCEGSGSHPINQD